MVYDQYIHLLSSNTMETLGIELELVIITAKACAWSAAETNCGDTTAELAVEHGDQLAESVESVGEWEQEVYGYTTQEGPPRVPTQPMTTERPATVLGQTQLDQLHQVV